MCAPHRPASRDSPVNRQMRPETPGLLFWSTLAWIPIFGTLLMQIADIACERRASAARVLALA